jgi:hypothetical protein
MDAQVRELLRRLAAVAPIEVPDGETGVAIPDESGTMRHYAPVLSVYLDLRPQVMGDRPAVRPARILLRERLHQIAQTFWPRGLAYATVRARTPTGSRPIWMVRWLQTRRESRSLPGERISSSRRWPPTPMPR